MCSPIIQFVIQSLLLLLICMHTCLMHAKSGPSCTQLTVFTSAWMTALAAFWLDIGALSTCLRKHSSCTSPCLAFLDAHHHAWLSWQSVPATTTVGGFGCAILSAGPVMQMMGFSWMFVLFLICAVAYHHLVTPRGIHWFQFLYFFSSFWGQFGPNATTWLLPGELFPTETRAMSHGISAAVGKVRASCLQSL